MARARNIKPAIFKNELLGVADPLLTLLFQSLWCLADKSGRLEDRPLRIGAETFPYREGLDIDGYLTELERLDFIQRYEADGRRFIQVTKFVQHQSPHKTERDSLIPPAPEKKPFESDGCAVTVKAPLKQREETEALPPDCLIPDSLIPDSKTSCAIPHDKDSESEAFKSAFDAYPKRAGGNSRKPAWKAWKARKAQGEDEQEMLDGVLRYAAFCVVTKKTGTEFVKMASSFFGPDGHYKQDWAIPAQRPQDTKVKHDGFSAQDYRAGVGDDGSF